MKNIITVLFIMVCAASCEKDLTVDIPPPSPKLVINGVITANSPFTVTIGKTVGILTNATPDTYKVTNAFVQLYRNNVLTDTLVYSSATGKYTVKRNTVAQTGNTYTIKVSASGFAAAEAETVVPANVALQSVTRRQNAKTDIDGNILDEIKITFTDDGTVTNYYQLSFRQPYYNGAALKYTGINCMKSNDKDIERRNNTDPTDLEYCIDRDFFLLDKNFNGKVKELIVFVNPNSLNAARNPQNGRMYYPLVELRNVTADHYKYRKSYDAYRDAEDNPFAEPVLVFTNVKNGYGFFGAYSISVMEIK